MVERAKLTNAMADRAEPVEGKRRTIYDTTLPGFLLRVEPSGAKAFYVTYRLGGGRGATKRTPRIGAFPTLTVDKARGIAREWLAEAAKGGDPSAERQEARKAPTMAELFSRYLEEHARPHKKPRSVQDDEELIRLYLDAAFSRKKVAEVTRSDVAKFHGSLSSKPVRANRCLALLSKAFNLAEQWGLRPDGSNPCRHVKKFKEESRKRFLSPAELGRLGEALKEAERGEVRIKKPGAKGGGSLVPPQAIAAIRLLIFTGCRRDEILTLEWEHLDPAGGRLLLPDTKTGFKAVPLNAPALAVLEGLRRVPGNPYVIPGAKPGGHLVNVKDSWNAIREAAGLEDVRLHDLRHSFAATGAGGGESLHLIGGLLGHSQAQTTRRYAHLADDPLRGAAERIGESLAKALEGEGNGEGAEVIPLRRRG